MSLLPIMIFLAGQLGIFLKDQQEEGLEVSLLMLHLEMYLIYQVQLPRTSYSGIV